MSLLGMDTMTTISTQIAAYQRAVALSYPRPAPSPLAIPPVPRDARLVRTLAEQDALMREAELREVARTVADWGVRV